MKYDHALNDKYRVLTTSQLSFCSFTIMPKIEFVDSVTTEHSHANEKKGHEGRHTTALKLLKTKQKSKAKRMEIPKSKKGQNNGQKANIVTLDFKDDIQKRMNAGEQVYYIDQLGMDMLYPEHSVHLRLLDLEKCIENNQPGSNKFNCYMGRSKEQPDQRNFVFLKISERSRIGKTTLPGFAQTLKDLLKNMVKVERGKEKMGISPMYACSGYRKNPKDKDVGQYTFKVNVSLEEQEATTSGIKNLIADHEARVMREMKVVKLNKLFCDRYANAKKKFNLPCINKDGFATQVAVSKWYTSPAHVDKDSFYSILSVNDESASKNDVIYHFCFPTYGRYVAMRPGDIIMFNPLVVHCASNPRTENAMIYSAYVSDKTCATQIANWIDENKNK